MFDLSNELEGREPEAHPQSLCSLSITFLSFKSSTSMDYSSSEPAVELYMAAIQANGKKNQLILGLQLQIHRKKHSRVCARAYSTYWPKELTHHVGVLDDMESTKPVSLMVKHPTWPEP
jgi:hypothetical protein